MLNLQQLAKTDPILLPILFNSIEATRFYKKVENRELFTKNINQLLSFRESRHSALSTLNIFCDHHSVLSSSLITEKTCQEVSWIEQVLRIVEQDTQYHSECFEILTKLLKITSCNPDTNKIVQSKYVQKIIDAIVSTKKSAPVESLSCLAKCFELYGGTTGIYKNKIYEFCVSFIDIPDENVAETAGLCLHLLQQSRGGSVAGGVYKKCWAEFHDRTLGSLEEVLGKIMKKSGGGVGKSEQLQLPELTLSPEPFNMYTQLFVRFQNLVTILQVSLLKPFPTPKIMQVSRSLTLIEDGIATSQMLLSKKSIAEATVLHLLHGQIHAKLLEVLMTLVRTLKNNIIIHSKTVCDILWRCLKQTNSHEQHKYEANLKLRARVYDAFIVFMRTSPNNFYIKNVMENLIKEALIDVTPANDEIYLMVPQTNGGGKSKQKRRINNDKKFAKGKTHTANIEHEQKVCAKALECLGLLLVYQGALMKPVLFFVIQEKITSISFMVTSKIQHEGDLYRDPHCRSFLCDIVGFMMIHPVHKMPVPLNYGIALLTTLKNTDPDLTVRRSAEMNLYRAETAIHNKKDVFYFPADYRDLRDTLLFNKQTIQKLTEVTSGLSQNGNNIEKANLEVDQDEESNDNVELKIMTEDEGNAPKDEETKEPEEVNEISDEEIADEAQNISDDEVIEMPVKSIPVADKRPAPKSKTPTVAKKTKVADKKDEELLDEYLADFDDEIV